MWKLLTQKTQNIDNRDSENKGSKIAKTGKIKQKIQQKYLSQVIFSDFMWLHLRKTCINMS